MERDVPVRKLSISVPPEIEAAIKAAAAEEGKTVSTWLAEAAQEKAFTAAQHAEARAAARELVEDYEDEHGTLPEESRQRAREFLAELTVGVGNPRGPGPVGGYQAIATDSLPPHGTSVLAAVARATR